MPTRSAFATQEMRDQFGSIVTTKVPGPQGPGLQGWGYRSWGYRGPGCIGRPWACLARFTISSTNSPLASV